MAASIAAQARLDDQAAEAPVDNTAQQKLQDAYDLLRDHRIARRSTHSRRDFPAVPAMR